MLSGQQLKLAYIDISAWRPITDSNTFFPYKIGYAGAGVEPPPYFESIRKSISLRDGYLEIGFGLKESSNFHPIAASNTFSSSLAKKITAIQVHKITCLILTPLKTLGKIILRHVVNSDQPIIFNIGIVGMN